MTETQAFLMAVLTSGAFGGIVTALVNHRGKTMDVRLKKDEIAFNDIREEVKHMRQEIAELKTEIKIKDEKIDTLLEENIKLKYENEALKNKIEVMENGTNNH